MSAKVAWDCYGASDTRALHCFADMTIALQPRRDTALAYSLLELARDSRFLHTAQSGLYRMGMPFCIIRKADQWEGRSGSRCKALSMSSSALSLHTPCESGTLKELD